MNEMEGNNRDYRDYRDYRNYRDYDNRDYRESYRDSYRDDYRDDYREDYRGDYRDDYRTRDYDRRGGKINNRNYRNYRHDGYYQELEMAMEDMREQYRKLEDIAEMAENPQEKNAMMKVAQKEKENYMMLKQMTEK